MNPINLGRVAMVPKGEWSNITNYKRLDTVKYGGEYFLALRDNVNKEPGMNISDWDAIFKKDVSSPAKPKTLLDIPTYDENPSTGHPSVVYVQNGWNGYVYWMADTPYPPQQRENPSVFASNDGVNWVEPDGIPNPVVPFDEIQADGYDYGSDTNLIMLPDNRLALYYRLCGFHETIFRQVSVDGISWGEKTVCVHELNTNSKIVSPSVIFESDGTFSMYSINISGAEPYLIQKRTSADGITWSEPSNVTHPLSKPWHLDVNLHDGKYRMLVSVHGTWDMMYLTSDDGENWVQPYSGAAIHRSGEDYDINGHYKAAMVPVLGQPVSFDIWITCLSSFAPDKNVYDPSCVWRTQYLKNVDLDYGTNKTLMKKLVFKKDTDSIWFSAREMFAERVMSNHHAKVPYWRFPANADSKATGTIMFPAHWTKVRVSILWLNQGTVAGNVRWRMERNSYATGISLATPQSTQIEGEAVAAAGQFIFTKTSFSTLYGGSTVLPGLMMSFSIDRLGTEASDTLEAEVAFMGVLFERLD